MTQLDPFTLRRLLKFIETHRASQGDLPTLKDLEAAGFSRSVVDAAIKAGKIEMFYVNLTNGSVVKGYKIVGPADIV